MKLNECIHENLERKCLDCHGYFTEEELRKAKGVDKMCKHKYIHLETKTSKENRTFGMPEWKRIDIYFCEKCLDEQKKYKYDCSWEKPEWY